MQTTFKQLNRGIKFSKAKHIEIRHFYSMINTKVDENDIESLCANAKNAELLKIKLKGLDDTLQTYKKFYLKSDQEKKKLLEENKELNKNIVDLKKDKDLYKESVSVMSQIYNIPQNAVESVLSYVKNQMSNYKGKDKSNENERDNEP